MRRLSQRDLMICSRWRIESQPKGKQSRKSESPRLVTLKHGEPNAKGNCEARHQRMDRGGERQPQQRRHISAMQHVRHREQSRERRQISRVQILIEDI